MREALSDEEALHGLSVIEAHVVDLYAARSHVDAAMVEAGSSLAGDDQRTAPYQTSHAVNAGLGAATDHLHALVTLVMKTRTLHNRAPFTLARATIENASTAYWLLEPRTRQERVHRTLRLHANDLRDALKAAPNLKTPVLVTKTERLDQLRQLADRAGVPTTTPLTPVTATAVVTAADKALHIQHGAGPLPAWQLFSGLAHGRPWAHTALLQHERTSLDAGLIQVASQTTPTQVLWATDIAWTVLDLAVKLFEQRRTNLAR